jgi:putative DNA primase/helicase
MTQNNNGDAPTSYGQATPPSFNSDSILSQENSSPPQLGRKKSGITEVSKSELCPHCGKPDWCYFLDNLSVCNRDAEPGQGWKTTSKRDRDGHTFYAPIEPNDITYKRANLRIVPTPPKKYKPAPLPKGEIVLAEFPEQPETPPILPKGLNTEIIYPYSSTQSIQRIDYYDLAGNRTKKTTKPWHINADGESINSKGDQPWPVYRLSELQEFAVGKWVLCDEGEKAVEAARLYLWLVCFTWMGSAWSDIDIETGLILLKELGVLGIVYFTDNDEIGWKKARAIYAAAAKIQFPCIIINPVELWDKMPEKGDIHDWIMAHPDWTREQFIQKMNQLIGITANRYSQELVEEESNDFGGNDGGDSVSKELTFCQLSFRKLYLDNYWICVVNTLYKWEETYYRKVNDEEEISRIAVWCDSYSVQNLDKKSGRITSYYPYANNDRVNQALQWAKKKLNKDLKLLNPPGINCLNGVLQIVWDADKPSWQLLPHSPDYYYTYPPLVGYNPNADSSHCDLLLSVLDVPQRDIFLKVVAASLDLETVRRYKGRMIKALLLLGTGSNGKDALRTAVSTIYGKYGLTSATLNDFHQYDGGRRFPLACLANSRINWASENTDTSRLDRLQSLKAAITGSPLVCESKGKDGVEFDPLAIFLFNINDTPRLTGVMEAILSRFGVLVFHKTFKIGADPSKGEIEADPRFAYDSLFLQLMVCPALLNRILDALADLMANGIDYACTQEAFAEIQAENSHLFKFAQDTGLTYSCDSYLSAAEIWEKLEQWYLDNGTLVYEENSSGKRKAVWADQPRVGDRNVKAVNQVLARFKQLFPKAKVVTVPYPKQKRNVSVLQGITFDFDKSILNKGECVAISESSGAIPHQLPHQKILINQDLRTNRTNFSIFYEENEKNEILVAEENVLTPISDYEFGKLVRLVRKPCPISIFGAVIGAVTGAEDWLIATHSPLLRMELPNDVVLNLHVQGIIENIREFILFNADWGTFQQYFAPIDEKLKNEAFKHLSYDELQILIALQPIDDEQRKAKEILDIINSGQDVDLRFSQAIAGLNQEEKDNLFCYLPHEYRGLLRRD